MSALTPQDLARLRLPGTIPGLLRRCSPAVLTRPEQQLSVIVQCVSGQITFTGHHRFGKVKTADLSLDLTDPTGQAHAAWWLAERVRPKHEAVSDVSWASAWGALSNWVLTSAPRGNGRFRWSVTFTPDSGLADLDPNDSRTLLDGRRYVDVLALVLVCEHVAGVGRG